MKTEMDQPIPELHLFDSLRGNLALFVKGSVLTRISEPMKEILSLSGTGFPDEERIIAEFSQKYDSSELIEAMQELRLLEIQPFLTSKATCNVNNGLQALNVEVDERSQEAADLIFKSVELLLSADADVSGKTIVMNTERLDNYSWYEKILTDLFRRARKRKILLNVILSFPFQDITEQIYEVCKKHPVQLLFNMPLNHRSEATFEGTQTLLRRLLAITNISVSVEGCGSEVNFLRDYKSLVEIGIPLFHTQCGNCDLSSLFDGTPVPASFLRNQVALSSTEVVKYANAFHHPGLSHYYCGAGKWYWAVATDGNLYPCHRFRGIKSFCIGNINRVQINDVVSSLFMNNVAQSKDSCSTCWARNICGGGCAFDAFKTMGSINNIDEHKCKSIKRNVEQCAEMYASMIDAEKIRLEKRTQLSRNVFPHLFGEPMPDIFTGKLKSIGNSMEPLIREGALLDIQYVHSKDIRIGDLFCFEKGDKVVTHRLFMKVWRHGKLFFVEKGDNATFGDIPSSRVLGKIRAIKNTDMKDFMVINTLPWRIGNKLIVVSTLLLSLMLFVVRWGYLFAIDVLKKRLNFFETIKSVSEKSNVRAGADVFRRYCRYSNIVIIQLLLSLDKIRRSYERTHAQV